MISYGLHLIEVKEKQNIMMIFFTPSKKLDFRRKKIRFLQRQKKCDLIGQKKSNKNDSLFQDFFCPLKLDIFSNFFLVDNILVNVHFDAITSILMFTKKKWRNFINVRFLSQVLGSTNYSCGSTCPQRF